MSFHLGVLTVCEGTKAGGRRGQNLAWRLHLFEHRERHSIHSYTAVVVVAFGWRSPVFGSILRRKGCLLRARHMHLRTWTTHRLPPSMAFASLHSNITILLLISETICNQPLFILPYCPPIQFVTLSRISKQDKLKHQFQGDALKESSIKPAIFEGVHVYVNGYTEPDSLTIKNMLAAHGGVWEQYNGRCRRCSRAPPSQRRQRPFTFNLIVCTYNCCSRVTHIVASQLPHSKIQKFLNAANPKNVVKPDWVVACIEAGANVHDS